MKCNNNTQFVASSFVAVFLIILSVTKNTYGQLINENELSELVYLNKSVDPCEDFYEYACGNFKNVHSIPDNSLNVDQFSLLQDELTTLANAILEGDDLDEDPTALKKARAAYRACVDEEFIDVQWMKSPEIEIIKEYGGFPLVGIDFDDSSDFGWYDIADVVAEYGVPLIFNVASYYDTQDGTKMVIYITQDPMGIPEQLTRTQNSYEEAIDLGLYEMALNFQNTTQNGSTTGYSNFSTTYSSSNSTTSTRTLTAMEIFLRKISLKLRDALGSSVADDFVYEQLDVITNFMKGVYYGGVVESDRTIETLSSPSVTLTELNTWTKTHFGDTIQLDWIEYLQRLFKYSDVTIDGDTEVLSSQGFETTLYGVINWVQMNNATTVKSMALLRIFLYLASDSDKETRDDMDVYLKAVNQVTYPRWEYCTRKITDATGTASLSFAVTYEYQLRHFNVNKLSQALQMVRDIQQAYREVIQEAEWMDDSSKEAALEKVDNVITLLGYPEFADNKTELDKFYENVRICKWDHYGNAKRIRAFKQAYQLHMLRKRDAQAWEKSPFDVNAYYNRPNNRIIFPVAVLNPIFFGGVWSLLDYSRIGSVIGHEITHGFDNSGRYYDQNNVLRNWWTSATSAAFVNRTRCFVNQYNKYYIPEIDAYVDGSTTLNENLADNGGTRNSYRAMKKLLGRYATAKATIPSSQSYTADQLFFIGFGTMWCNNESQQYLESWQKCTSSCHARSKWRVNGVLSNMEEFADAFSCPSGSNMNPTEKCRLW